MKLHHAGKTAIVTGAASGLGRALALRLLEEGWRVALADIDAAKLDETLALAESIGGDARAEVLDVSRPEEWKALVARLRRDWGDLDLLVNNAGVCGSGEVGSFGLDDWRWLLDVNLYGAINGCHATLDWLKQNSNGPHIVNISSIAAAAAGPTMGAYNVSKAGLISLSETMYVELARHGVGVTVVCSGFFRSNLLTRGRFRRKAERSVAKEYMLSARISADQLAGRILKAVARKKLYLVTPLKSRLLWNAKQLAPTLVLRYSARLYSWAMRKGPLAPKRDEMPQSQEACRAA